jgi:hypothetical protein
VVKRPKAALKNQKNSIVSSDSTSSSDAVDVTVVAQGDEGDESDIVQGETSGGQSGQGFSPLDLLRCMEDPFPSNRPVRVSSLASLRGRS